MKISIKYPPVLKTLSRITKKSIELIKTKYCSKGRIERRSWKLKIFWKGKGKKRKKDRKLFRKLRRESKS
jgi:hypothetical protein